MMRDWFPMVTAPGAAGILAAAGFDLSVATSMRRMPPRVGAGNSRDSRCSPSTSATAFTVAPGVTSLNCARPFSSVLTVNSFAPPTIFTGWLTMLFESDPRMSRTEIAPFGRSSTGRGMPLISRGSGIWNWPAASRPAPRTQRKEQTTQREKRDRFTNISFFPLSLCVLRRVWAGLGSPFSERPAAGLAKLRILIVLRAARAAPPRGGILVDGSLAHAFCEVFLDPLPVPRARVEILDQARGAGAQAPRHLAEVVFRQPAHRAIEFELFDGAQREHLFAFERRARALPHHRRPIVFRRHERPHGAQRRVADERGGAHQHAEQDDRGGTLAARHEGHGRRAAERGEEEELPRLEAAALGRVALHRALVSRDRGAHRRCDRRSPDRAARRARRRARSCAST